MELRFEDVRLRYKQKSNVFKTGPISELKKLLVHGLMVGPMVQPRSNR